MTREDVIRMVDEAKLTCVAEMFESELERFAALVAAAEREACAKVCDEVDKESQSQWPKRLATMIRARRQA
jgi:hypothetical protein